MAYLRRQFRTIAMIVVPLAVLVFFTSTHVLRPDGSEALSFVQSGIFRTLGEKVARQIYVRKEPAKGSRSRREKSA